MAKRAAANLTSLRRLLQRPLSEGPTISTGRKFAIVLPQRLVRQHVARCPQHRLVIDVIDALDVIQTDVAHELKNSTDRRCEIRAVSFDHWLRVFERTNTQQQLVCRVAGRSVKHTATREAQPAADDVVQCHTLPRDATVPVFED